VLLLFIDSRLKDNPKHAPIFAPTFMLLKRDRVTRRVRPGLTSLRAQPPNRRYLAVLPTTFAVFWYYIFHFLDVNYIQKYKKDSRDCVLYIYFMSSTRPRYHNGSFPGFSSTSLAASINPGWNTWSIIF
jgi:hypothetical protein